MNRPQKRNSFDRQMLAAAVTELFASVDAAEGVQSFIERRDADFQGR